MAEFIAVNKTGVTVPVQVPPKQQAHRSVQSITEKLMGLLVSVKEVL